MSVWIAVLRAQLLLRATRVSAADAPPILEERQAREGNARTGTGGAEGKAEGPAGGEAGAACGPAETGRGGGLRERSPRRSRRARSDRGADEGRVCEARCRVSGRRCGVRRGISVRAVQGRDPRPRGLARLPPPGGLRARCDSQTGPPAAQFLEPRPPDEGPPMVAP